jgi:hypothetical protein
VLLSRDFAPIRGSRHHEANTYTGLYDVHDEPGLLVDPCHVGTEEQLLVLTTNYDDLLEHSGWRRGRRDLDPRLEE